MATESGGDETGHETGGPGDETGDKTAATLVTNKTAATGGVMYTDEGELEFDEDEWQRFSSKASMRVSQQEISVAETTVDRKRVV